MMKEVNREYLFVLLNCAFLVVIKVGHLLLEKKGREKKREKNKKARRQDRRRKN